MHETSLVRFVERCRGSKVRTQNDLHVQCADHLRCDQRSSIGDGDHCLDLASVGLAIIFVSGLLNMSTPDTRLELSSFPRGLERHCARHRHYSTGLDELHPIGAQRHLCYRLEGNDHHLRSIPGVAADAVPVMENESAMMGGALGFGPSAIHMDPLDEFTGSRTSISCCPNEVGAGIQGCPSSVLHRKAWMAKASTHWMFTT